MRVCLFAARVYVYPSRSSLILQRVYSQPVLGSGASLILFLQLIKASDSSQYYIFFTMDAIKFILWYVGCALCILIFHVDS
ncbi:unnamed protein product [Gongylonema pulchrum]|uniref:Ovule protein n=1 Tax=Gongylonema pulchrum TaxID=637853 RepID=A0A183D0W1_9BILA|nr:unnamed protein product [Gongylonema pulchrum]